MQVQDKRNLFLRSRIYSKSKCNAAKKFCKQACFLEVDLTFVNLLETYMDST